MLDKGKTYRVQLPDECWWIFKHEIQNTMEGIRSDWRAYRRRPGMTDYSPQGPYPEIEILHRLTTYQHRLSEDDKLDLIAFLYGDNGKHWDQYLQASLEELRKDTVKEWNS